jgi:hypothetical protein
MTNLTVVVDDDVLRRARQRAIEGGFLAISALSVPLADPLDDDTPDAGPGSVT